MVFSYLHSRKAADRLVTELSGRGARVHAVAADLYSLDELRRLLAEAERTLGGIDMEGRVERGDRLGGLHHEYRRAA